MKKLISILVAMAMMLSLTVIAAFAEGTVPTADEDTAKLVKWLVVPEGTSVPAVTNEFTFAPYLEGSSGVTQDELETALPGTNGKVNIDIPANYANYTADPADGNSVYKAITLPGIGTVTHPGVYAYSVRETNSAITDADSSQKLVTDTGAYIIRYTVKNNAAGNGLEVDNITAQEATVDPETDEITPTEGAKVTPDREDPTGDLEDQNEPETPDDPSDDTFVAATDNGISFKNTYQKTNGDNTFPNAPLKISKTVTDKAGTAIADDETTFPMTIKLTKAVGADDTVLQAGIYDKDGNLVANSVKEVPYGDTGATFEITTGQTVAFLKMPAGTRYTVSETMANAQKYSAYAPNVAVTTADTDYEAGLSSADLGETLAAQKDGTTILLKENAKDVTAYTNKYDSAIDTPTGILISNLPYIALALVAIGGLVAYVVVRRRQDDEA